MSPDADDRDLLAHAQRAQRNAYAPYSHFAVGAAVRVVDGSVFTGCNVENASYGIAMCAEQVAVAAAIASGAREIAAVAVWTDGDAPVWPCGRCRQTLFEFGPTMRVVCATRPDNGVAARLDELLPSAFSPVDLER